MKYIVPEYYPDFQCKCGECRHFCCEGWPVRITAKEYYRLLGINCSDRLRSRLDCALKICREPSYESYAEISTDWCGICMLHREDGLCIIQSELGESSLPEVCRLYPRSTKRISQFCLCSCSNSCEAIVELLLQWKEPLKLIEMDIPINPEFEINLPAQVYERCKKSVSLMQDRSLPLPERFIALGNFLCGFSLYSLKEENLSLAFRALILFDQYYESSLSVNDYCSAALRYFGIDNQTNLSDIDLNMIAERYASASEHLKFILPDWQILFEQLLVNHMYYNIFPYNCDPDQENDSFLSLAITYSFLRFNTLGYMADKSGMENLVDLLAAMFRLIEHSDFSYTAVQIFRKENYSAQDYVPQLLSV